MRVLWLLLLGLAVYLVGSLVLLPAPLLHYAVLVLMGGSWLWGLRRLRHAPPGVVRRISRVVVLGALLAVLWLASQTANDPLTVSAMAVAVVLAGLLLERPVASVGAALLCGLALVLSRWGADVGGLQVHTVPLLTAAVGSAIHLAAIGGLLAWFGIALRQGEVERERSARFHADLFRDSPVPIFLSDAQGTIVAVNPATERLLQLSAREILGKSLAGLGLISADVQAFLRERRARVLQGEPVPSLQIALCLPDGTDLLVESTSARVVLSGGEALVQVVLRDLRDRRRAERLEENLRRARDEARRTEALVRMAGGMAHDANNLLTIILSAASFALEDEALRPETREDIQEIERAGQRAAAIARQLLAFSRRQVLSPERTDLNLLMRGMERRLRTLVEGTPLLFSYADHPCWVDVDVMQLERVLHNLLTNARDASPPGASVQITVRCHPDLGEVELSVADQGAGIPPEVQERMFEPFFTTKATGRGSGLGLSTALGIVAQSGGRLSCQSASGQGSVFTIILPGATGPTSPAPPPPALSVAGGAGELLLVVDDEPRLREMVARDLEGAGYRTVCADGVAMAEDVYARHPGGIALLVTDVVMADGSGVDLAARLAPLPTLFLSGQPDVALLHRLPVAQFLPKPFSRGDLLAAVRRCLDASA